MERVYAGTRKTYPVAMTSNRNKAREYRDSHELEPRRFARYVLEPHGHHPEFWSVWRSSVLSVLRHLGDYGCPLERVLLQWGIGPIKIEYVEKNIRTDQNRPNDVNRPPEFRAVMEPEIV